jgi:hypothetical protein
VRFVDETEWGFGWVQDEPVQRCSHALVAGGRVWVIDPLESEGVEQRIHALGEPAGVVQLLDRHGRDCAAFARRLGVEHHELQRALAPFEARVVAWNRFWREVALWVPERRALVCADAVGTVPVYFTAPGEVLGVHPLLRLVPPRQALAALEPEHVLVGHGAGVHTDAAAALRSALDGSRRHIPAWVAAGIGSLLPRGRS